MDTVIYFDEQRMSRLDCKGAHIHLDIRCSHMTLGHFSNVAHHIILNVIAVVKDRHTNKNITKTRQNSEWPDFLHNISRLHNYTDRQHALQNKLPLRTVYLNLPVILCSQITFYLTFTTHWANAADDKLIFSYFYQKIDFDVSWTLPP